MAPYYSARGKWVAPYVDVRGWRRAPSFDTEAEANARLDEEAEILKGFEGVDIGHDFEAP